MNSVTVSRILINLVGAVSPTGRMQIAISFRLRDAIIGFTLRRRLSLEVRAELDTSLFLEEVVSPQTMSNVNNYFVAILVTLT